MKKLLIVGAGAHGKVVKEIAESHCEYKMIDFLDDNSADAIGTCSEYDLFKKQYTHAFVAIGNSKIRHDLIKKLEGIYEIPKIIHPRAYISPSSKIGKGCYVGAMSVVSANAKVGEGAIIGIGTMVDHDCVVGEYCYISAGVTIAPMGSVDDFVKVEAGGIVKQKVF